MQWTYTGNDPLASAATKLFQRRGQACALSPYVFMTDPKRTPHILRSVASLPRGSAVIYRHFGADNAFEMGCALRQVCFVNDVQFLIGQDEVLARRVGADGLHLPERELGRAVILRSLYPDWILSGAVHDVAAMKRTKGLDAIIISSLFQSQSPSAGVPLGVNGFNALAAKATCPVIGLGGIHSLNVNALLATNAAGIAGASSFCGGDYD